MFVETARGHFRSVKYVSYLAISIPSTKFNLSTPENIEQIQSLCKKVDMIQEGVEVDSAKHVIC